MWSIKEELGLGKGYIYCSKNAVDDTLAAANFGKAAAWVSGAAVVVGQRVVSVSIQYKNLTGVNTTTAPASDTTNWAFDFENFQTYVATKTYNTGNKTVNGNLHYICNSDGVTGTFNATNWTQVPISNRSCPYKLMNTAIVMLNADARFVSYEVLDTILNKAYHNIHLLISNGLWNESLTVPTKYIRIVGQSKWKTILSGSLYSGVNWFFQNLYSTNPPYAYISSMVGMINCISDYRNYQYCIIRFSYKNVYTSNTQTISTIYHFINNTVLCGLSPSFLNTSIIKNNIFSSGTLTGLGTVNPGGCDYNTFSSAAILSALKAAYPLQNANSVGGATYIATNADYTLPPTSPCIGIGANGNNIGAEGVGRLYDNTTSLNSTSGATYRNITKLSTTLIRDQIGKFAQGGTSNTIILSSSASTVNNEYSTFRCYISSGPCAGETKTITSYDGSTKIASLDSSWTGGTPTTLSTYEILDGEVTSTIMDLGSAKSISKLNTSTVNYFDLSTSTIITQNVSTDDARNYNSELNFELKCGLLSDLSDGTWVKFKQDELLSIDANGRGCGDPLYNPETIIANALTFRYFQFRIQLHK